MRRSMVACMLACGLGVAAPPASAVAGPTAVRTDLQAMINATGAGGTLRLRAGRYDGGVTIDRPITIEGPVTGRAVIDGGGKGTVVAVVSPDVTLRRLTIQGSGSDLTHEDSGVHVTAPSFTVEDCRLTDVLFGIHLRSAADSVIRGNDVESKSVTFTLRGDGIHVYQADRTRVEDNRLSDGRDMIAFFSSDVVVRGNSVRGGRYGLHLMYSDRTVVENNRLERNLTGVYVMYSKGVAVRGNVLAFSDGPSGYGLAAKESDISDVVDNRMVGNRIGVFLDGSPFSAALVTPYRGNVFAYNDVGAMFQPSVRNNAFSANSFIDNREQVSSTSGGSLAGNDWTIGGVGNHWSDYAGYDADDDGVGDVTYRAEGLYDALTDRHPQLVFFADTPAARALDAAARAFPALRPEPKAVDDRPLIDAPVVAAFDGLAVEPSRSALAAVTAALLSVALVLASAGRRRRSVRWAT